MATEAELISALSLVFSKTNPVGVEVGIGDDGAVILPSLSRQIAVADMAVEGVHFRRDWSSLAQIGAKLTAANLADIFAMGGQPKYLLITAGLPQDFSIADISQLAQGIQDEADLVDVQIIGGDLSQSASMVISITALGESQNPILRSGAKPNDFLFLSALTGWSAAGLACLQAGLSHSKAIAAHLKPEVDYVFARELSHRDIHSLCDVSDGLISEAHHLASASQVKIVIDTELCKSHSDFPELFALADEIGADVWDWILAGGEDHCFLGTVSDPSDLPSGALVIGRVHEGTGVEVLGKSEFKKVGYSHFQGEKVSA